MRVQQTSWIFFITRRDFLYVPYDHVICFLLYKHQWNANHFYFVAKGATSSYAAIATVISSRVKITCHLHMWRCHVFENESSLVYIINWPWFTSMRPNWYAIWIKIHLPTFQSNKIKPWQKIVSYVTYTKYTTQNKPNVSSLPVSLPYTI